MIKEEALKYETRFEFQKNSPAYQAANKKGILNEVCSHMTSAHVYWTTESIQKEANKYISRKQFEIGSRKAYTAARIRGLLDQICAHMKSNRVNWTIELIKEEASKYESNKDFQLGSPKAYSAAFRKGILDDIRHNMVIMKAWTKELVEIEAKKYNTRTEFSNNSDSAYNAARRLKILDQVCSHMVDPRTRLTDEYLKNEALKCSTRAEFQKNNASAYRTLIKRGSLEQSCSHMKVLGSTSLSEKELLKIIKSVYPKAQKLVDRKASIKGKLYITGFDLDIYVPELRKAIEFDGTYWHSPEGLLRGRPNWNKEDLKNYHEIKDSYFKSKGINILHIKQEDWDKNKESCIQKCFDFLQS